MVVQRFETVLKHLQEEREIKETCCETEQSLQGILAEWLRALYSSSGVSDQQWSQVHVLTLLLRKQDTF